MTVGKRVVLASIQVDGRSRELLNWALIKVAEPGDHVLAFHVCRTSESGSRDSKSLGDYLEGYEGLCRVKQVTLSGQSSLGNSVRKAVVREAKKCQAAAVVVGISKQNALRNWASMARYCARHLPPTTEVLAVNNGKVIFRSCSTNLLPGILALGGDPKPSICRTLSGGSEVSTTERLGSEPAQRCNNGSSDASYRGYWMDEYSQSEDLSEPRAGWPLLQSSVLVIPQTLEARNMSVVQWVMALPDRYSPETPPMDLHHSPKETEAESPSLFGKNSGSFKTNSNESILSAAPQSELLEELKLILSYKSSAVQMFSYNVLRACTSDFSSENLIGRGGCNLVYKGVLADGKPVAVKILKSSSKEAWKDFVMEVEILSSLKHKNILPLMGICIEVTDLIISVYDYMSKGSLEERLLDASKNKELKSVLSWDVRFKIAVEVAEALDYLQNEGSCPIIHRDIKSSNILLSHGFEPQISDFGLAIWGPTTPYFLTQDNVVGTFGYLAPEYFMYGKVSDKIDVYSFGVVLLELLSGRRCICCETAKGQDSLVMWAKPILDGGDTKDLIDPNLNGNFDDVQLQRIVLAAALCITRNARLRPKINQILKLLRGVKDAECVRSMQIDNDDKEGTQNPGEEEDHDDEVYPKSSSVDVESHLSLALVDVEEFTTSFSSFDRSNSVSIEEYLKGRSSPRSA